MRQAAAQLGQWRIRHQHLRLNVNLSARHFRNPDCVARIEDAVDMAGADPASITLELTETAALTADPAQRDFLRQLRDLGFRIVLDDFGSGYAFIEQMLRLPIDGIKLDNTTTAAMGSRRGDAVVRHLIALATDLDLDTVIEGIEHPHQADQARRVGATYGQGYLWSPGAPTQTLTEHLKLTQLKTTPETQSERPHHPWPAARSCRRRGAVAEGAVPQSASSYSD